MKRKPSKTEQLAYCPLIFASKKSHPTKKGQAGNKIGIDYRHAVEFSKYGRAPTKIREDLVGATRLLLVRTGPEDGALMIFRCHVQWVRSSCELIRTRRSCVFSVSARCDANPMGVVWPWSRRAAPAIS
jgi:hypothetical protein